MPHPTIFRTPWVEITPHYEEIALRYGGAALERLRAFGLAERREAAIATILAGGVPLIGLLLLDWSPATAVLALLLNLWLTMFEDLAKIVRARGRLAAQQQLCNQDEFVWPIVRALARRRRTLDGRDLPVPELLDVPHRPDVPFVFAILATIAVAAHTPVHANTKVSLDFQGLTGVPVVALEGGDSVDAAPVHGPLIAENGAGQSMTQAAREALRRVDTVLSENAAPLHDTIGNLGTFAEGLARNTPRLEGIIAGLERMTATSAAAPRKVVYDLRAVDTFGPQRNAAVLGPLVMAEPTAITRLQTQRFLFAPDDLVLIVGQDGLVANVAKYLDGQHTIGVNPDPARYDGVLCRHAPEHVEALTAQAIEGDARWRIEARVLAEAVCDDGQRLLALNEIFVGHVTHQSARYRLRAGDREERHSSSGVIISTGSGATGWTRSIVKQRGLELALHFVRVVGAVAEDIDQIGLPIGGPVTGIGRVEGGFLVIVVGVLLAQHGEGFGGCVGGYCLGQELLVHQGIEMGPDLGHGVTAHGHRSLHHQPGFAQHLLPGVAVEQIVGNIAGHTKAGEKDRQQDQIEFESQAHG